MVQLWFNAFTNVLPSAATDTVKRLNKQEKYVLFSSNYIQVCSFVLFATWRNQMKNNFR